MKNLFWSLCLLLLGSTALWAQAPANKPQITFEKAVHDFGDITQGDVVSCSFKFKNTGTAPLIISDIQVTCGCTQPSKPKAPIMPGKTDEISVSFNSAGKIGKQNKVITIRSNASNAEERVTIITNILPPKDN